MILKTRAGKDLCRDCKLPEEIIDRYFESLTQLVWRAAKKERAYCQTKIRSWQFNQDIGKPSVLEVLRDDDDGYELL